MPWAELHLHAPWGRGGKGHGFSTAVAPCVASHPNVSEQVGVGGSIGWVGGGRKERERRSFLFIYCLLIYSMHFVQFLEFFWDVDSIAGAA